MRPRVQAALYPLQAAIGARDVRWVAPENLHLTLKFLGDTPTSNIPDLIEGIALVASKALPFKVVLEAVGCFPNRRKPCVIWLGIHDNSKQLGALQAAIEAMAQVQGFAADKKPFHPHLTVGRVKGHIQSAAALAEIGNAIGQAKAGDSSEWPCTDILLMASDLQPSGPIYTCLHKSKIG